MQSYFVERDDPTQQPQAMQLTIILQVQP